MNGLKGEWMNGCAKGMNEWMSLRDLWMNVPEGWMNEWMCLRDDWMGLRPKELSVSSTTPATQLGV